MLHLVYARCVALSLRTPVRKRRDADDAERSTSQSDTRSTEERVRAVRLRDSDISWLKQKEINEKKTKATLL